MPVLLNSIRSGLYVFDAPLREDLAKPLAARCMRIPPVRVLLDIFIGEHRFKRPVMQIQIQHIRMRVSPSLLERDQWQTAPKQGELPPSFALELEWSPTMSA